MRLSDAQYRAAAEDAVRSAELDSHAFQRIANSRNLTLLLFFGNLKDIIAEEGPASDNQWAHNAFKGLLKHHARVYDRKTLRKVHGCAEHCAQKAEMYLWSAYPPEPQDDEDRRLEAIQDKEAQEKNARKLEANRKRKAEDKAREQLRKRQELCDGAGPDPLGDGMYDENGMPPSQQSDADDAAQPGKKQGRAPKAPKPYKPGFRTANYTFMCMLLKHQRLGLNYPMTKSQLMDAAESSGISQKPIKGSGGPVAPSFGAASKAHFNYDGWSNFNALKNKEPPLVNAYSNPVKIKLTPEGEKMAVQFFQECVNLRLIDDLPAPFSVKGTDSPSQPLSSSQPPPSRPPSQAFRNASQSASSPHSASQHRHTSASLAASHRPTSNMARPSHQHTEQSPNASWHPSATGAVSQPAAMHNPLLPNPSSSLRHAVSQAQPAGTMQSMAPSQPRNAVSKRRKKSEVVGAANALGHNPLLPHPSSCLRAAQGMQQAGCPDSSADELAHTSALSQQPMPERVDLEDDDVNDADVAQVMDFATCSHAKARKALQGGCTVEEALMKCLLNEEEDGNDIAYASQQADMLDDEQAPFDIPMAASQSNAVGAPARFSQGNGPAPSYAAANGRSAHVPLQQPVMKHTVHASGPHTGRWKQGGQDLPSASCLPSQGGSLQHANSPGSQQSGLEGASQARQGTGHIQQAALESSKTSWQLPPLGIAGSLEEQDIRLPPLSPGRCFNDEYELVTLIDSREKFSGKDRLEGLKEHVKTLTDKRVLAQVRTLVHGDVLWMARSRRNPAVEYVLDYILERKRTDDLLGSIKSNRYETQKYGMRRCGLRHLMYLVEGDPDHLAPDSSIQAVKTASLQTEIIGGFTVVRSDKCSMTMQFLAEWSRALHRKYAHLRADDPQVQQGGESLPTFEGFKAVTTENKKVTVQDVWGLVLTSLPGWSDVMVAAVVTQYGTPLVLFKAYERVMKAAAHQGRDPVQAARQLLTGCDLNRNRRAISVNNSATVFDTLFGNGWQVV